MQQASRIQMNKGKHHQYFWLQSFDQNDSIDRFLKEFKQHLVDKFVCVSAFDSGELHIANEEKKLGWQQIDNIAISPKITIDTHLPTAGFDEWYIFTTQLMTLKLPHVYVNDTSFNLAEDSTVLQRFWQDIAQLKPQTYLADGDSLKIVTTDESLWQEIEKYWR